MSTLELINLLSKRFDREDAEQIALYFTEINDKNIENLTKIFLTKDDKVDLITRMDSHFKSLVMVIIGTIGVAVAIMKLWS